MSGIPEATPIILTSEERAELEGLARSTKTEHRMPQRARIVLLAEDGVKTRAIGAAVLVSLRVGGATPRVIQAPKPEPRIMRYELTDLEWAAIKPMTAEQAARRARVNDRCVLNGIFWVLRSEHHGAIAR